MEPEHASARAGGTPGTIKKRFGGLAYVDPLEFWARRTLPSNDNSFQFPLRPVYNQPDPDQVLCRRKPPAGSAYDFFNRKPKNKKSPSTPTESTTNKIPNRK
jgi:hypothetical protein